MVRMLYSLFLAQGRLQLPCLLRVKGNTSTHDEQAGNQVVDSMMEPTLPTPCARICTCAGTFLSEPLVRWLAEYLLCLACPNSTK